MEKLAITEEMGVHHQWNKEAKEQSIETLERFVRHLSEDYGHDYGTIVHATFAAMLAAFNAVNSSPQGGLTGFQANCLMWLCIRHFGGFSEEGVLQIFDSENLLYPQYDDQRTTISFDAWSKLQESARKKLEQFKDAHPGVVARWESVARGEVPCGLTVLPAEDSE